MLKKVSILKKATSRSHKQSGKRDGQLNTVEPDFWDINISFYPRLKSYIAANWHIGNEAQIQSLEII